MAGAAGQKAIERRAAAQPRAIFGPQSPSPAASVPSPTNAMAPASPFGHPTFGRPALDADERTAAIPTPEDLGSTMALPPGYLGSEQPAPSPHYSAQPSSAFSRQSIGRLPPGSVESVAGGPSRLVALAQRGPSFSPTGVVGGVPMILQLSRRDSRSPKLRRRFRFLGRTQRQPGSLTRQRKRGSKRISLFSSRCSRLPPSA